MPGVADSDQILSSEKLLQLKKTVLYGQRTKTLLPRNVFLALIQKSFGPN